MHSGAPLRQGLFLVRWNHPSSAAQPGGTGAADPWEVERSLLSWEAHTAWMADNPPMQTGSKFRASPGERIYKVPLVLGTKSNVQDILQQTAALQLVLALSALPAEGLQYPGSTTDSFPFHMGENKNRS